MKMNAYVRCVRVGDDPISLTVGEIYEVLPVSMLERQDGWLRIIDNEGHPYLHPAQLFEPVEEEILMADCSQTITVHVSSLTKLKLRNQARARGMSLSALLRTLAEERLDLPATV